MAAGVTTAGAQNVTFVPASTYPTATPRSIALDAQGKITLHIGNLLTDAGIDNTGTGHYARVQLVNKTTGENVEITDFKQYWDQWVGTYLTHFENYGYAESGESGIEHISVTFTVPYPATQCVKVYLGHQSTTWDKWNGPCYEPTITAAYTYTPVTYSLRPGTEPSNELAISRLIADNATSATVSLTTDELTAVKNKFTGGLPSAYIKWMVRNKATGQMSEPGGTVRITINEYGEPTYSDVSGLGYVWNTASITDKYSHGLCKPNGEWFDSHLSAVLNATWTPAAGTRLSDYELVCLIADDDQMTVDDAALTRTEPVFRLRLRVSFNTESTARSAYRPKYAATKTVTRKALVSDTATTLTVNIQAYINEIKAQLGGETDFNDFYYRFYLTDRDGTPLVSDATHDYYSASGMLKANDTTADSGNDAFFINNYGKIYHQRLHTDSWNDTGDKFTKVTFTLPTGASWTDYRIACVMTNHATEDGAVSFDQALDGVTADFVQTEPTMRLKRIVQPETDENKMFVEADVTKVPQRIFYQALTNARTFTVNLNNFADRIAKDYGQTDVSRISPFYLRWQAVSRTTGRPLPSVTATLSGANGHVLEGDHGLCWHSNMSGAQALGAAVLNVTVTNLPDTYTQDDIELVCYTSHDLSHMGGQMGGLVVSADPEIEHKYIMRFVTPEEAEREAALDFPQPDDVPAVTLHRTVKTAVRTIDVSDALSSMLTESGLEANYLHFYVTDARGSLLDATGAIRIEGAQDVGQHGMVVYRDPNARRVVIPQVVTFDATVYPDLSLDQLHVVCDAARSTVGATCVGNIVMSPPNVVDARLIIHFKPKADTYSQTTATQTFTHTVTHENNATGTVALDLATDVPTAAALAAGTGVYVRWYLADRDGDCMTTLPDGITLQPTAGSPLAALSRGDTPLGYLYYGTAANADALKINVEATGTANLNDYRVVCAIATTPQFDAATTTPEPALAALVTYTFASAWEGTLTDDAFRHTRTILIADNSVASTTLRLDQAKTIVYADYRKNLEALLPTFHLRWYVEQRNANGEWERTTAPENCFLPLNTSAEPITTAEFSDIDANNTTNTVRFRKQTGSGVFWNAQTGAQVSDYQLQTLLGISFTKPQGTMWSDLRVVAVMSDDPEGTVVETLTDAYGNTAGHHLAHEPQHLGGQWIYYFTLAPSEADWRFVHAKGASARDFYTPGSATVQQYAWDYAEGTALATAGDIRQSVHTVEYTLYADPTSTTPVPLKLGMQDYMGNGNNLEHRAYIRWYDWRTDMGSTRLADATSGRLRNLKDNGTDSRGLFILNIDPTQDINSRQTTIGVTYDPTQLTAGADLIACDVSKYYDGIQPGADGTPVLIHEPTLSLRYLFHIRPASECMTALRTGDNTLSTAIASLKAGTASYYNQISGQTQTDGLRQTMFASLMENQGRVVVSVKDGGSKFSVRAELPDLGDYYKYAADGTSPEQCSHIAWKVFFEDDLGLWEKDGTTASQTRITEFTLSQLGGRYKLLAPENVERDINAQAGQKFHLVGYLYGADQGSEVAVSHYDLRFVTAPAYTLEDLYARDDLLSRRDEYLAAHLEKAGESLTFNSKKDRLLPSIAHQIDAMSTMPAEWEEAHYGFCYPLIDDQRLTIGTLDFQGISPLHGEYMLLKSMNDPQVTGPFKYNWWHTATTLHDYTHTRGLSADYGSFLYVDASDESRAIANIAFQANLCTGSEIAFTMYVADMTSGPTPPQVMAHVYAGGQRIMSFLSSEINTVTSGEYAHGRWYQIYGHGTMPDNIDVSALNDYEVEIDNYSTNTDGADYCIDQITFYTSTAQVKVKQQGAACDDETVTMSIHLDAENLKSTALGVSNSQQTFYWRICEQDGTPVAGIYPNAADDATYGTAKIVTNYDTDANGNLKPADKAPRNAGFFTDDDGNICFSLMETTGIPLKENTPYYVSIYNLNLGRYNLPDNPNEWGSPDEECSVASSLFLPKKVNLRFSDSDGESDGTVHGACSGATAVDFGIVLRLPDDTDPTGFRSFTDLTYDFFKGTKDEFVDTGLKAALDAYRLYDPTGTTLDADYDDAEHHADYLMLSQAIQNGTLLLQATTRFQMTFAEGSTKQFVANPVEKKRSGWIICSPIPFSFAYQTSAPVLVLGFPDVDYSRMADAEQRVVRIGTDQIANLKDGYVLHLPVCSFKNKAQRAEGQLILVDHMAFGATNDTQFPAAAQATIVQTVVDEDHKVVVVSLNGCTATFREGYYYTATLGYCDADDYDAEAGAPIEGACTPTLTITFKVVPKYVTWTAGAQNTCWNNDANWVRSTKAELYKGSDYTDDASAPAAYVPMKFTRVTLPGGNEAPVLTRLTTSGEGIYDNLTSDATQDIAYDLMTRTETTCLAHGATGTVYDCEKYYGNWAKEIYLKPSAELLNQHYLTYDEAWVEAEVESNQWQLMATPLQHTYAGDFYAPKADGRQTTEAFTPITFNTTTYARAEYPVYQHAWNLDGANVYTRTDDLRATSYSANLPYTSVTTAFAEWSHSYNDVQVPYTTLGGFALRAHKEAQNEKALFRLPKEDTKYDYYQWDNALPATGQLSHTVSKPSTGKLLTDGTADITGTTYGVKYGTQERTAGTGDITATLANLQQQHGYVLVGNPYLCSIDMTKFLAANNLTGYTRFRGGTPEAKTGGTVRPMEAFLVQATADLTFTPSMMTDGYTPATPSPAPRLRLTAAGSHAELRDGETHASVEALIFPDAGPTVVTLADGRALAIAQSRDADVIPFAVVDEGSAPVPVTVDVTAFDTLYAVDATTGTATPLAEGTTIDILPNEYGRYYLTTRALEVAPRDNVTTRYYNIQGQAVDKNYRGVVIRRAGGKAVKVLRR